MYEVAMIKMAWRSYTNFLVVLLTNFELKCTSYFLLIIIVFILFLSFPMYKCHFSWYPFLLLHYFYAWLHFDCLPKSCHAFHHPDNLWYKFFLHGGVEAAIWTWLWSFIPYVNYRGGCCKGILTCVFGFTRFPMDQIY